MYIEREDAVWLSVSLEPGDPLSGRILGAIKAVLPFADVTIHKDGLSFYAPCRDTADEVVRRLRLLVGEGGEGRQGAELVAGVAMATPRKEGE